MADQTTSNPAGGQPANPFQQTAPTSGQQPESQPAGGQGTEYLTRAEAETLKQDILRSAQSLVDKSSNRIEAKVQEVREKMGASGVQLTAEQEATLRANLATENQPSPAPVQSQPAQAQPAQGQVDPALLVAYRTMQAEGVIVEQADPEFKNIAPYIAADGTVSDPLGLLNAVKAGMAAKRTRNASKENPISRVPLGGGVPPAGQPLTNSRDAWRVPDLFKQ